MDRLREGELNTGFHLPGLMAGVVATLSAAIVFLSPPASHAQGQVGTSFGQPGPQTMLLPSEGGPRVVVEFPPPPGPPTPTDPFTGEPYPTPPSDPAPPPPPAPEPAADPQPAPEPEDPAADVPATRGVTLPPWAVVLVAVLLVAVLMRRRSP